MPTMSDLPDADTLAEAMFREYQPDGAWSQASASAVATYRRAGDACLRQLRSPLTDDAAPAAAPDPDALSEVVEQLGRLEADYLVGGGPPALQALRDGLMRHRGALLAAARALPAALAQVERLRAEGEAR